MINFSEVENSVKELKKQLAAGQIDEKTFEDQLLQMIDVAEDGYYWMFGHESERWFRHDGQQWQPDDPGKLKATSPKTGQNSSNQITTQQNPAGFGEAPVNGGWLVASIILILTIGWIVYVSSLAY